MENPLYLHKFFDAITHSSIPMAIWLNYHCAMMTDHRNLISIYCIEPLVAQSVVMFGVVAPNEHQYFKFQRPIVYWIEGMTKRPLKLYISNITNHLYSKSPCPAANWHSRAINEDKTIIGYSCHWHLQFNYDPLFISEHFMFFLDWPANVILVFMSQ